MPIGLHIRRLRGASRWSQEPGVLLRFPQSELVIERQDLVRRLNDCKITSLLAVEGPPKLMAEEAVGLVAATLTDKTMPRWSCGRERGECWVCLSSLDQAISEKALILAAFTIGEYPAISVNIARQLQALQYSTRTIDGLNIQMARRAKARGIHTLCLSTTMNTLQIGEGRQGMHCFELATHTDSLTGFRISSHKLASNEILRTMNLPATEPVSIYSEDQARSVAARIGYPCVAKPTSLGKGKGVTANIRSEAQLITAVRFASAESRYPILLEQHVQGWDHRIMIVRGKMLWAYRRTPPHVIGDGTTTIATLIERENSRRSQLRSTRKTYLNPISIDESVTRHLECHHSLSLSDVPTSGQCVVLSAVANIARGGVLTDMSHLTHPDNQALAAEISELMRINCLGVDFITPDISRSWKEIPSAVIEINCTPGISGEADASLALDTMMPMETSGRIPIVLLLGSAAYRKQRCDAIREHLHRGGIQAIALDLDDPEEPASPLGSRPPRNATNTLRDRIERSLLFPHTEALIVATTLADASNNGLPMEFCTLVGLEEQPEATAQSRELQQSIRSALRSQPDCRILPGSPRDPAWREILADTVVRFREPAALPTVQFREAQPDSRNPHSYRATARIRRLHCIPAAWLRERISGDPVLGFLGQDPVLREHPNVNSHTIGDLLAASLRGLLRAETRQKAQVLCTPAGPEAPAWEAGFTEHHVEIKGLPSRKIVAQALRTAVARINELIGEHRQQP
jgi:D-alanine-D-alanine ligase-like ATP-grasp enzyme